MNYEPVAWQGLTAEEIATIPNDEFRLQKVEKILKERNTHPTKELDEQFKKGFEAGKEEGWKAHKFHHPAKTLTDEEILQFRDKVPYSLGSDLIDFARTILRKAQEK